MWGVIKEKVLEKTQKQGDSRKYLGLLISFDLYEFLNNILLEVEFIGVLSACINTRYESREYEVQSRMVKRGLGIRPSQEYL